MGNQADIMQALDKVGPGFDPMCGLLSLPSRLRVEICSGPHSCHVVASGQSLSSCHLDAHG